MFNRNVFLYWICVSYSHSPRHRTLLSISFGHAYNLGLLGTFHEQREWMAGMVTVPLTWDAGKYSQISQRHITRPEMIAKWWDESPFPVQHSLLPLKLPHPLQPTQALLTHLLDQLHLASLLGNFKPIYFYATGHKSEHTGWICSSPWWSKALLTFPSFCHNVLLCLHPRDALITQIEHVP